MELRWSEASDLGGASQNDPATASSLNWPHCYGMRLEFIGARLSLRCSNYLGDHCSEIALSGYGLFWVEWPVCLA